MALPKINSTPKYDMTIPSTNETVRFRPFLVKEEKVLMIAMESNDNKQMLNSIVDTLDACVENGVKRESLTTFDVEYMFTKLRAKSVGETANLGVDCQHCEEQNEITVDIDTIEVDVPDTDTMIDIGNNINVEMRWPSFTNLSQLDLQGSETEQAFAILRASIAAVHTEEERIDLKDESNKEIQDFIESMNRHQFEKIQKFVEAMPTLSHQVNFKCTSCKKDNEITLQGMQSFF